MKREDFRFFDRLRVRWAEVDMQKIVFNGHYLMYFDTAVAGYWRAMALPYHETMEQLQGDLYVRKATVEYLGSARYEDRCEVGLRCQRIGNSSLLFVAALFRGETLLVHGELVYVFANPNTQTSQPVPPPLREVLQAFESGQAMWATELADWHSAHAAALPIRTQVFAVEQGVPVAMMSDEADASARHVLVRNRLGMVVGSGRLVPLGEGQSKIGRMAVLQAVRGAGVGQQMLQALLQAARSQGDRAVVLDAQSSAVPFYRRAGFAEAGEPFEVAGIRHQHMRLALV